ncbi:hypothetical protein [Pseudomonas phage vB_Pa-PAC2]
MNITMMFGTYIRICVSHKYIQFVLPTMFSV